MFDLTGKTALVTGASRGIGKSIARTLKQAGAEVILTATNPEVLASTAKEIGCSRVITADLSTPEGIEKIALQAGNIDILVNNAGITKDGLFLRQSQKDWSDVLNINLTSAVALTQKMLPNMLKNRNGRIINITSVVGHTGNTGQTNYVASKAGLTGFARALSTEIARKNITVNCIAPGFIETEMTKALPEATLNKYLANIPAKRFGQPQNIADAVVFLASEEANYITGTTLHVDGGMVR